MWFNRYLFVFGLYLVKVCVSVGNLKFRCGSIFVMIVMFWRRVLWCLLKLGVLIVVIWMIFFNLFIIRVVRVFLVIFFVMIKRGIFIWVVFFKIGMIFLIEVSFWLVIKILVFVNLIKSFFWLVINCGEM